MVNIPEEPLNNTNQNQAVVDNSVRASLHATLWRWLKKMNRSLKLQEAVESLGNEFFSAYPHIPNAWDIGGEGFDLSIVIEKNLDSAFS